MAKKVDTSDAYGYRSPVTGLRRLLGVALLVPLIALAACDGDDDTTSSTAATPTSSSPHSGAPTNTGPNLPTGDGVARFKLAKLGDFESPVYVTQPPHGDEHLYVVEQTGRIIQVAPSGGGQATFLDLSDQVTSGGEQGLLSMAFAPDFADSRLFYVDYTDTDGNTQVVEYHAPKGGVADPESARSVIEVDQPFTNHNGGQLQFGPDRLLYIGLGDGGSEDDPQRNGQDLSTPLAKILRIDPRPAGDKPYGVPGDNPFAGQDGTAPETYAYGLRNPWRFSFDRTGDLWIGDVGQNEFEEVDGVTPRQAAGANFGWSAFEGDTRFNDDQHAPHATRPVLTYSHDEGCSVTGGYVVRDRELPSLYGRYLYGDFCQGDLRSFTARPGAPARDDRPLGVHVPSLSSFGEDAAGDIYVASLDGPVYQLVEER
jgi:glucose/arabinose dehydrogenase